MRMAARASGSRTGRKPTRFRREKQCPGRERRDWEGAAVLIGNRLTGIRPGQRDQCIPGPAASAAPRPFGRFLPAGGADIGDDHTFLEMQGFLEFGDGLLHLLLAKIEIGHDLMVIDQLVLHPFDGREDVEGFVDHFESVVELAEIELQGRVVRILPEGFLIDTDNFTGLALFEKEFFEAVQDDDAAGLGIDFLENFYGLLWSCLPGSRFHRCRCRPAKTSGLS